MKNVLHWDLKSKVCDFNYNHNCTNPKLFAGLSLWCPIFGSLDCLNTQFHPGRFCDRERSVFKDCRQKNCKLHFNIWTSSQSFWFVQHHHFSSVVCVSVFFGNPFIFCWAGASFVSDNPSVAMALLILAQGCNGCVYAGEQSAMLVTWNNKTKYFRLRRFVERELRRELKTHC